MFSRNLSFFYMGLLVLFFANARQKGLQTQLILSQSLKRNRYRRATGLLTTGKVLAACLTLAALAGCAANSLRPLSFTPSASDIRTALQDTGAVLIRALRSLKTTAPEKSKLDYQTAITLEALRLPTRHVAERGLFYKEAATLDEMLSRLPHERVPKDVAVLSLLAGLAGGKAARSPYLSPEDEQEVLNLCGPSHLTLAREIGADEYDPARMLRQSCFTWLLGDAPKSRALFYHARASAVETTGTANVQIGADTPFDEFIDRLYDRTGVNLLSYRQRLQGLEGATEYQQPTPGEWKENLSRVDLAAP